METAHRFPILQPGPGESLDDFLRRAADVHNWPRRTLDEDLVLIHDTLTGFAENPDDAAQFGAYILRALSFAAHSSMALRHLDRYLHVVGAAGKNPLAELRDNPEHLHFLCSFFSFSTYLSEIVIRHPEWLSAIFRGRHMNREKPLARYREEAAAWLKGIAGEEARRAALTAWKKHEQLRIGVREILEYGSTAELCREISNMAQAIVEVAMADCHARLVEKHGRPIGETEGVETGYCIYAMGKFGAGELNFSSDVDLVFLYDEEGRTEGVADGLRGEHVRRLSNHEFFCKLSHEICAWLSYPSEEGFLFRVDTRLRPEGAAGPLARSRSAYVAYLGSQAGLWEKVAYLKARCLTGDAALAAGFDKILEAFVYTNNLPSELLPEIARLKHRIDFEGLDEEGRELDIKRGRGGIREIEFITVAHQLIAGDAIPALRVKPTLEALERLAAADVLPRQTTGRLAVAYVLFRRIEHTLQMMAEQQTHRMPTDALERERLSIRCGFPTVGEFEETLASLRGFVRGEFERVFHSEERAEYSLLNSLLTAAPPPAEALQELRQAGLGDVEGFQALQNLAVGTGEYAPSARGQMGFQRLLPRLLEELPDVALPRDSVRHFDLLLRAARGFTWVYELCLSHPPILKLLLRLLGFGSVPARQLIAHPEWLEELIRGGGLHEERAALACSRFRSGLSRIPAEQVLTRTRVFKQLESFLVCAQDVLAVCTSSEAAARMTLIAETALDAVIHLSIREVTGLDNPAEFPVRWGVIGLGGLGDRLVHATGDLDLAFVVEDNGDWRGTPAVEWVDRIAQRLIAQFGAVSPEGQLWKIDARLRPEGNNGPLAATRGRFLQYYREEAGLWEWQALTKARPVAGDRDFTRAVLEDLYALYGGMGAPANLADEVRSMRARMEANLRLPKTALFDMKLSRGGITTVEFLIQCLQLGHPGEAATLFPITSAEALEEFGRRGEIAADDCATLRRHLALLRTLQRHHRLLWETTRDHYPADPAKQEALARGVRDQLRLQELAMPASLKREMDGVMCLYDRYTGGRSD